MTYTMTRARWPGILQIELDLRLRTDGTPNTKPTTWDMTVSIGSWSIVIDPCHMKTKSEVNHPARFSWQLFTLRLDRPVDINNPWGP